MCDGTTGCVEFDTAAEKDGKRGWLNIGKTLPDAASAPKIAYPIQALTPQNAASVPCEQVLGSCAVRFGREK